MKSYQELESENKILVKSIGAREEDIDNLKKSIETYDEENAQIKKELYNVRNLHKISKNANRIFLQIFVAYVSATSLATTVLILKPYYVKHVSWFDTYFNLNLPTRSNRENPCINVMFATTTRTTQPIAGDAREQDLCLVNQNLSN